MLRITLAGDKATTKEHRGLLSQATAAYAELGRIRESSGSSSGALQGELGPARSPRSRAPSRTRRGRWCSRRWRDPLEAMAPADRPYSFLALIGAMVGRAPDVKKLRADWEAVTPAAERDSGVGDLVGRAHRAVPSVGRGRRVLPAAQAAGHCSPCGGYERAYALDQGGHADSAMAVYARILQLPVTDLNGFEDGSWYPLADLLGSASITRRRVTRRKPSTISRSSPNSGRMLDPDLQPKVKEARARIAELAGEKKP